MDVIEKAKELGEMLSQDERCKRLMVARANNDGDSELQNLIGEFNLKKIQLKNEFDKEPPEKAKIEAIQKGMNEVYAKIMSNKSMAEFNEAKKPVDELVSHITDIIRISINGEAASCGGDCASCHGCE